MHRIALSVLTVIAMITGFVGCGSEPSNENLFDLQGLGVAYHAYHAKTEQGPDSADDLINMLTDPAKKQEFENSSACKKLKSGEFVLNPRIQFRKAKDITIIPIIYEKQVPTDGGIVVMCDGSTKRVTAAEFKQLDNGDYTRAEQE